jgi:cell division protein FtsB
MILEDEVERLHAENADLHAQVTQLEHQLTAALARIAQLE